ncbi:GntR family transcriptional regulator, partial [Micromonospora tulbaghiae]
CEHYEVSNTVIRAAMLLLKAEGLIDGRQGKGVYVANPLPR